MTMTELGTTAPIAFANYHAAISGSLTDFEPYLLASRFFHCGIIDRTRSLEMGFNTHVLDPLDEVLSTNESDGDFATLCEHRAEEILAESRSRNCSIDILWSGGIDSTVALSALIQAARNAGDRERLRVLLSVESITEYPGFFHQHIKEQLRWTPIGFPVSRYLSADSIIVTGEHGDLLFGSNDSRNLVSNGIAYLPWRTGLPLLLAHRAFNRAETDALMDYLTPLVDACPFEITTLFEFSWWMDFTQKWQMISLRIAASVEQHRTQVFENTRHFFRSIPFQLWALFGRERETMEEWCQYKMAAKDFIYDFNGDDEYRDCKEKESSLRQVLFSREIASGSQIQENGSDSSNLVMDEAFEMVSYDAKGEVSEA
jgi:hypothetical protein